MTLMVYSGWDPRQTEAAEVFRHSVLVNAKGDVDVLFLRLSEFPSFARRGVTEFSYSRFLVPHLQGFQGRAVFADGCDMLCLGDMSELAAIDMHGAAVMVVKNEAPRQDRPRVWTSFMLLDCARLKCWTPQHVSSAPDERLMRLRDLPDPEIGALDPSWNTLVMPGNEPPPGTRIAHWSALANPNGSGWIDRSKSKLWAEWRERWRAPQSAPAPDVPRETSEPGETAPEPAANGVDLDTMSYDGLLAYGKRHFPRKRGRWPTAPDRLRQLIRDMASGAA